MSETIGVQISQDRLPTRHYRRLYAGASKTRATCFQKRSEDALDYHIDLTNWLETAESIESALATCESAVPAQAGDINCYRVEFGDTGALVWLSNGRDNIKYSVQCRIATSQNRILLVGFCVLTRGTPTVLTVNAHPTVTVVGGGIGG